MVQHTLHPVIFYFFNLYFGLSNNKIAMVDVDGTGGLTAQVVWLGLMLALSLHSSSEPGELSQWL